MSLPPLTVVPAGAGSGKTYRIQHTLGDRVEQGLVRADRIVAVTFTEAAASELRDRVRGRLLELDRHDDALRIDQAYISTIHSFGLRLLSEFAFEAGMSPHPRLLQDDEEKALIRAAIPRSEKGNAVLDDLSRFGYQYSFSSGEGPEDQFRGNVLTAIQRLRMIGRKPGQASLVQPAVEQLTSLYGTTSDASTLNKRLLSAVQDLLSAFPDSLAPTLGSNKTARKAFEKDYFNLKRALQPGRLESDWKLWQGLRNLRQSKRGTPTPDNYDELALAVMEAAGELPNHPGPLRQAVTHIESLLASAEDVLASFAADKRDAGLLDYADMVTLARQLLLASDTAIGALGERVDCVVIDEFQDTNPIQFALLWRLHRAGIPALIVGDLKQAIMGFQGTDARLFEQVTRQHPEAVDPLTDNWRSDARLMEFINGVGTRLFDDDYQSLKPQAEDTLMQPLEVMHFPNKLGRSPTKPRAGHVGLRLKSLLNDPAQQAIDRRTGERRRLRAGDIAVLCPTHFNLTDYANVFRNLGLRVRLTEEGWFESRIIQLALQALQFAADPTDRHAALYLATTELGTLSLEQATGQLVEAGSISDEVLERLSAAAQDVELLTLPDVVAQVIDALDLYGVIARWPDGEQARANLLRLEAEARDFLAANRETLSSGGYYGGGIPTFLAWLSGRVEGKDENKQPDPRVIDEEAIELVTWHSSKGREWPVVVVAGLDWGTEPRLPEFDVQYANFDNLDELLDGARITWSPQFAAPETNENYIDALRAEAYLSARRVFYVALTRAREKLILEWPDYLAQASTPKPNYWLLMTEDCGLRVGEDAITIEDVEFPCVVTTGAGEPAIDDTPPDPEQIPVSRIGRIAIESSEMPTSQTPDSISPSVHEGEAVAGIASRVESYGPGLDLELGLPPTERGELLHRCFEVLAARPDLAERYFTNAGVDIDDDGKAQITVAVAAFEKLIQAQLDPTDVSRELPLLAKNDSGSVLSGVADLIVETSAGLWIIDHKSDRVTDTNERFAEHLPQLLAYENALLGIDTQMKIAGVGINWLHRGEVQLAELG